MFWRWIWGVIGLLVLVFICGCLSKCLTDLTLRCCLTLRNGLHRVSDAVGEYTVLGQNDVEAMELGEKIDEDLLIHKAYFDELDAKTRSKTSAATSESHPYTVGVNGYAPGKTITNPHHKAATTEPSVGARKQHLERNPAEVCYTAMMCVKSPSFQNIGTKKQVLLTPISGSMPDIVKCSTRYDDDGQIADSDCEKSIVDYSFEVIF